MASENIVVWSLLEAIQSGLPQVEADWGRDRLFAASDKKMLVELTILKKIGSFMLMDSTYGMHKLVDHDQAKELIAETHQLCDAEVATLDQWKSVLKNREFSIPVVDNFVNGIKAYLASQSVQAIICLSQAVSEFVRFVEVDAIKKYIATHGDSVGGKMEAASSARNGVRRIMLLLLLQCADGGKLSMPHFGVN